MAGYKLKRTGKSIDDLLDKVDAGFKGGGSFIPSISIPYNDILNLATKTPSATSDEIIVGIGQGNLDKIFGFEPLNIELTNLVEGGSIFTRKNFIAGNADELNVSIPIMYNESFVFNKINGEYQLIKNANLTYDSILNSDSNNAPQTRTVYLSLQEKQDTLVSGETIKTINGESILGSGNIAIGGGSGGSDVIHIDLSTLTLAEQKTYVNITDTMKSELTKIFQNNPGEKIIHIKMLCDSTQIWFPAVFASGRYNYLYIKDFDGTDWKMTFTPAKYKLERVYYNTHDLTIDVKTGCKNGVSTIYYRIREVVPNGYIQFVRKKKTTYRTPTVDYKQSRYSVKDLSVHNISGVAASTLQPNVWYEFPISNGDLVSTYAKGSLSENGVARAYDMFKFNGNTHARPIEYSNMGTAPKATTVLHAGLQYNVLEDTFVKGTSANPIFKQRGEVIPIDVRLTVVDTSGFAAGFKLIFAVQ